MEFRARDAKRAYKSERYPHSRDSSLGSGGGSRPQSSMSVGRPGRSGGEQEAPGSSDTAGASAGGIKRGSRAYSRLLASGATRTVATQPQLRVKTRGSRGGPGNGGMSGPRPAPGKPATPPIPFHSLLINPSTPIGVSTIPASAGGTSQGIPPKMSSAVPVGVERMEGEEGEVADPLDPNVQSAEGATEPTGSSMTPTGTTDDKPASN